MVLLSELIQFLEELAPIKLAEKWDNVGLMLGSKNQMIHKVLCALDLNEEVVDEAIKIKADCIVTHHPFLFAPLKKIDFDTPKGALIKKLILEDISIYSMHTNFDAADQGINTILCEKLGLGNTQLLDVTYQESFVKCIIYVPEVSLEAVREVIIKDNECTTGNYSGCTFSTQGEGTFMPLAGSAPYIGTCGTLEKVQERKVEFMCTATQLPSVLKKIKAVHPYEEMAYDVFELKNNVKSWGIGRYGSYKEPISLEDFINKLKNVFGIQYVRATQTETKNVQKVAICSGSGASYIQKASKVADVYVTADLKFHEAQEAKALGLCVIDVGHYASENIAMGVLASWIQTELERVETVVSTVNAETLYTL